ncbi:MAG: hypothetical protein IAI48_00405 [Candidatus Eremiobacteraeota bacterium]|nr:hypothetical protein [Candidatus Eremiobacteraeota bacterium]
MKPALNPKAAFRKKFGIKPKGDGPHAPSDYGLPVPDKGHPLAVPFARAALSRAKAALMGGRFEKADVVKQVRKANTILYGKPAPPAADKVKAQKRRTERDLMYHFGEASMREGFYPGGLAPDGSFEQISNALQNVISQSEAFGGKVIPYSVDPDNTTALRPGDISIAASYPTESKVLVANYRTGDFWTVPYTVGEDGKSVSIGDPSPAEIVVTARAKEALREAQTANPSARLVPMRFTMAIAEAQAVAAGGPVKMVAIRVGHGNPVDKNYYDEAFIESIVPMLAGADCFYDHPSAFEDQNRPERAIRDKAGWFSDPVVAPFKDPANPNAGEVPAAYAVFNPREGDPEINSLLRTWRNKIEKYPEKEPFVAFSINAYGVGAPGQAPDGSEANIISKCAELRSVDLVTSAGAGGRPVLTEADLLKTKPKTSKANESSRTIDPSLGIDIRTQAEKDAAADTLLVEARRATVRDILAGPMRKAFLEAAGPPDAVPPKSFSDDDVDAIADKTGIVKGGAMHQMMKDNLQEDMDGMESEENEDGGAGDGSGAVLGSFTQAELDALPENEKAVLRKAGVLESGKTAPAVANAEVVALKKRVETLESEKLDTSRKAVIEAACEKLKIPAPHRVRVERWCANAKSNDEIATITRAYFDANLVSAPVGGGPGGSRPSRESRAGEAFKPNFTRTR